MTSLSPRSRWLLGARMLTTTQRRLLLVFLWIAISGAGGYALGTYFRPWEPGGPLFAPRPALDDVTGGRP